MDMDNTLVKLILLSINKKQDYGFKLLNSIKSSNRDMSEIKLYSTLKSLEKLGFVSLFKSKEYGMCCVNVRYALTPKGQDILNEMINKHL